MVKTIRIGEESLRNDVHTAAGYGDLEKLQKLVNVRIALFPRSMGSATMPSSGTQKAKVGCVASGLGEMVHSGLGRMCRIWVWKFSELKMVQDREVAWEMWVRLCVFGQGGGRQFLRLRRWWPRQEIQGSF
ncbi:hypothetical protein EV1_033165 [Malus domestica]